MGCDTIASTQKYCEMKVGSNSIQSVKIKTEKRRERKKRITQNVEKCWNISTVTNIVFQKPLLFINHFSREQFQCFTVRHTAV